MLYSVKLKSIALYKIFLSYCIILVCILSFFISYEIKLHHILYLTLYVSIRQYNILYNIKLQSKLCIINHQNLF